MAREACLMTMSSLAVSHCGIAVSTPSNRTVPSLASLTKRSEEHTSELQSRGHLVCRLLLEKKNNRQQARARADHEAQSTAGHGHLHPRMGRQECRASVMA